MELTSIGVLHVYSFFDFVAWLTCSRSCLARACTACSRSRLLFVEVHAAAAVCHRSRPLFSLFLVQVPLLAGECHSHGWGILDCSCCGRRRLSFVGAWCLEVVEDVRYPVGVWLLVAFVGDLWRHWNGRSFGSSMMWRWIPSSDCCIGDGAGRITVRLLFGGQGWDFVLRTLLSVKFTHTHTHSRCCDG